MSSRRIVLVFCLLFPSVLFAQTAPQIRIAGDYRVKKIADTNRATEASRVMVDPAGNLLFTFFPFAIKRMDANGQIQTVAMFRRFNTGANDFDVAPDGSFVILTAEVLPSTPRPAQKWRAVRGTGRARWGHRAVRVAVDVRPPPRAVLRTRPAHAPIPAVLPGLRPTGDSRHLFARGGGFVYPADETAAGCERPTAVLGATGR
jgi:hypothetical protein